MSRLTDSIALVVAALLVLSVTAQNIDIDKLKTDISNGVLPDGVLPEGVVLPEGINVTALPSQDDIVKVLKQKCQKISGNNETYASVEQAAVNLQDCITRLVDFEQMKSEIEKAQPNGELDSVFNKYCQRRTTAIECMNNFTVAVEPCLEKEEIKHKVTFVNIFTNLLNFVCHKDGDQIALFIAEKGPECFESKKDALSTCFNQTFSGYAVPNVTVETLPMLVMGPEQCRDMNKLQQCVVSELEHCQESTPANLVDALFKFVRQETPCVNMTPSPRVQPKSNAAQNSVTTIFMAITLTTTVLGSLVM